jgi:hypothetical protein
MAGPLVGERGGPPAGTDAEFEHGDLPERRLNDANHLPWCGQRPLFDPDHAALSTAARTCTLAIDAEKGAVMGWKN